MKHPPCPLSRTQARRGSFVFTIGFAFFVFFLSFSVLTLIDSSKAKIMLHKQRAAASSLASSGLTYGAYMVREGPWRGKTHICYHSPVLDRTGYFILKADRTPEGLYCLVCTGHATDRVKAEKTEIIRP